ncbi:glycosyltransferase [Lelliottia nimipressuralis]|uniref:glycosyltransferase n=1 Tax=Lelliottia nimipressuralis TaxID=69220 RepID=UPI00289D4936|nr:glycosyltransferase [Lelliottia nimipressuralis]
MKITIVNTQENFGGAAIAAKRLHNGLQKEGITSELFVMNKISNEKNVVGPQGKIERIYSRLRAALDGLPTWFYTKRCGMFSAAWWNNKKLVSRLNSSDSDIIHLHWINAGFLSVADIKKLKKPVVITLHDMWYFTGGCHYNGTCAGYQNSCGKCPLLGSHFKYDLSYFKLKQKKKIYKNSNVTFIPLSNWIGKELIRSKVATCNKSIILPNPIDFSTFTSIDKRYARALLDLPQDRTIVTFGAVNSTSDTRKGYRELINALNLLTLKDVTLVIFGTSNSGLSFDLEKKYDVRCLGYLNDELTLRVVYSSADVMIVPSREENLSNTIIEALACNTPVVAFDIGGNCDMVEHKKNGFLAKYDITGKSLAEGLSFCLEHLTYLSENARQSVVAKFDSNVVINKYIDIYRALLLKDKKG